MAIEVFTTGYPKSGNTWLNRLLSDLLDSPLQTPAPGAEIQTRFCDTGLGGYVIRKTHWLCREWVGDKRAMVFIQRDPRDVAVSAMHYLSLEPTPSNLVGVILAMTNNGLPKKYEIYHRQGYYEPFVRGWLNCDEPGLIRTRYADLHASPIPELSRIYRAITNRDPEPNHIQECYERQRFDRWQGEYPHSMRKGVVGDWVNHFASTHRLLIDYHLGELMLEQGYIKDRDWWMKL